MLNFVTLLPCKDVELRDDLNLQRLYTTCRHYHADKLNNVTTLVQKDATLTTIFWNTVTQTTILVCKDVKLNHSYCRKWRLATIGLSLNRLWTIFYVPFSEMRAEIRQKIWWVAWISPTQQKTGEHVPSAPRHLHYPREAEPCVQLKAIIAPRHGHAAPLCMNDNPLGGTERPGMSKTQHHLTSITSNILRTIFLTVRFVSVDEFLLAWYKVFTTNINRRSARCSCASCYWDGHTSIQTPGWPQNSTSCIGSVWGYLQWMNAIRLAAERLGLSTQHFTWHHSRQGIGDWLRLPALVSDCIVLLELYLVFTTDILQRDKTW